MNNLKKIILINKHVTPTRINELIITPTQINENNKFNFIEKVIYINLLKRNDRRVAVEQQLHLYFPANKIVRFNAIYHEKGFIGCTQSHIGVLQMAINNKWKNCLIVEDDIEWIKGNDFEKTHMLFNELVKKSFDAIVLNSNNDRRYNNKTYKLNGSTSTGAYFVKQDYYNKLISNYKEGLNLLLQNIKNHEYRIDQFWQRLHKTDNWYILVPSLCNQKDGYSDVNKTVRKFTKNNFS